ncbi:hypothetical protein Rhe02_82570 [Rhizocola hellebori]|uniref:Uncharacterized protein n=1 Tax=Rhizocola hellebori TaxID=1392758 RepID=A0A8J3QI99_9ACTN|nr:hypothetical protein [Rhizocola hellebori]GIH10190.1 hypothetical protein Rhe02_82570 [Rhizocola hellebori]
MLIEVEKLTRFGGGPLLAQVQTPIGRTAVCWHGLPDAQPGPYHVEWTIDEPICWGRNARLAEVQAPWIGPGAHGVILRGRLECDGAGATLDLGGSVVLLELLDPVPDNVAGGWVDLFTEREKIGLYPFDL